MDKDKKTIRFSNKVQSVRDDIEVINYFGLHEKAEVKCKIHNFVFFQSPRSILEGRHGCKFCQSEQKSDFRKLNTNDVKNRLNSYNSNLLLLSEYEDSDSILEIKCIKCGHIFNRKYKNIRDSIQCPNCSRLINNTTDYIRKLEENNIDIFPKEEYINLSTKILHHCKKHDFYWKVSPSNVLHGRGCPQCKNEKLDIYNKNRTYQLDEYNQKLSSVFKNIKCIEYKGVKTKSKHVCLKCNIEFMGLPDYLLRGTSGCPNCHSKSRGEEKIYDILYDNAVNFEYQYTFEDCVYKRKLPFDFVIFNKDDTIKCVIEYQGHQHYKPTMFGGVEYEKALENYNQCILRDSIKKTYCQNNNIYLLEIKYTDYKNIEEILIKNNIIEHIGQEAS